MAGVCVAKGGRTLGVEQCFGDGMGGGRMAVGKEAQKNGRCNFFLAAAVWGGNDRECFGMMEGGNG